MRIFSSSLIAVSASFRIFAASKDEITVSDVVCRGRLFKRASAPREDMTAYMVMVSISSGLFFVLSLAHLQKSHYL